MSQRLSQFLYRNAILFLLLVLSSLAAPLAAQDVSGQLRWGNPRPPQSGACFYKDENFGGQFFCVQGSQYVNALPPGFNDKISSIRLFGRARITVFNDNNFGGLRLPVDRDIRNLKHVPLNNGSGKNWNDRISSIRIGGGR
jgi:hypothetical protein